MSTEEKTLDKVRKLLAKAEADGVTPAEAEALTAKAAEMMARYGIDRARVTAKDKSHRFVPASKKIDIDNPWANVRLLMLNQIAKAMRCECIQLHRSDAGSRLHIFGSADDIERAEVLYTSLLLQMASALRHAQVPARARSPRAWRRSFLLGYVSAVGMRVLAAENRAREEAKAEDKGTGTSTELVLVGREVAIKAAVREAYPATRYSRSTYSGRGYSSGYSEGQRANIGGTGLGQAGQRGIAR